MSSPLRALVPAVVWLAVLAIAGAPLAQTTPDDLAGAREQQNAARVARESAATALAGVQQELNRIKDRLTHNYRVLDDEVRRKDRDGEADTRLKLENLRASRDKLLLERDRATLVVDLRQVELEAARAVVRIHELQSSSNADASEIKSWQKKHEKASARALRLERRLEELPGSQN